MVACRAYWRAAPTASATRRLRSSTSAGDLVGEARQSGPPDDQRAQRRGRRRSAGRRARRRAPCRAGAVAAAMGDGRARHRDRPSDGPAGAAGPSPGRGAAPRCGSRCCARPGPAVPGPPGRPGPVTRPPATPRTSRRAAARAAGRRARRPWSSSSWPASRSEASARKESAPWSGHSRRARARCGSGARTSAARQPAARGACAPAYASSRRRRRPRRAAGPTRSWAGAVGDAPGLGERGDELEPAPVLRCGVGRFGTAVAGRAGGMVVGDLDEEHDGPCPCPTSAPSCFSPASGSPESPGGTPARRRCPRGRRRW